ncbi:hypothetical protein M0811_04039 [Anaeramoeba ignava]|uniref:Uncharacterized protein n=1 Tax=Anaeramoeba ignava TaxID=1746090 RepID=A0A9Q0LWA3_ANAIG|nr:hypothetical protein M0811_04039 [Anaeramoeba ignava]
MNSLEENQKFQEEIINKIKQTENFIEIINQMDNCKKDFMEKLKSQKIETENKTDKLILIEKQIINLKNEIEKKETNLKGALQILMK